MNFSTASLERRAGLVFAATATALALSLTWTSLRPAFWPEMFLAAGFGAAILNVISQNRRARGPSAVDFLLVAVTGFAAVAADASSLMDEAILAVCRMIVLGGAIGGLAFAYAQLRGAPGISPTDIKLVTALGVALPLAMSIYAVGLACCAAIVFAAIRERSRGGLITGRQHVATTGVIAGTFYIIWLAYRLAV